MRDEWTWKRWHALHNAAASAAMLTVVKPVDPLTRQIVTAMDQPDRGARSFAQYANRGLN